MNDQSQQVRDQQAESIAYCARRGRYPLGREFDGKIVFGTVDELQYLVEKERVK
jgi:hypothetical protein